MAGHSKWSKVTSINGPLDQKRGQLFSKLAREITVVARMGGGGSSGNHRLRPVVLAARVLILEAAAENRSRTVADLRLIPAQNHGNLALLGAVSYIFHRKGRVTVPAAAIQKERLFDLVIEAGGEELAQEDEHHVITTAPDPFCAVAEVLQNAGVQADLAPTEEALAQFSI